MTIGAKRPKKVAPIRQGSAHPTLLLLYSSCSWELGTRHPRTSMSTTHTTTNWLPAKSWQHFMAGGCVHRIAHSRCPFLLTHLLFPSCAVLGACAAPSSRAPLTWSRRDCSQTYFAKNTRASAPSSGTPSCSFDGRAGSYGTLSRRHISSGASPILSFSRPFAPFSLTHSTLFLGKFF